MDGRWCDRAGGPEGPRCQLCSRWEDRGPDHRIRLSSTRLASRTSSPLYTCNCFRKSTFVDMSASRPSKHAGVALDLCMVRGGRPVRTRECDFGFPASCGSPDVALCCSCVLAGLNSLEVLLCDGRLAVLTATSSPRVRLFFGACNSSRKAQIRVRGCLSLPGLNNVRLAFLTVAEGPRVSRFDSCRSSIVALGRVLRSCSGSGNMA